MPSLPSQLWFGLIAVVSRIKPFFLPRTLQQFFASLLVIVTTVTSTPVSAEDLSRFSDHVRWTSSGVSEKNATAALDKALHTLIERQMRAITGELRPTATRVQTASSRPLAFKALPNTHRILARPLVKSAVHLNTAQANLPKAATSTNLLGSVRGLRLMQQQANNTGLGVSLGFADNSSASPNFPSPWQGSSNVNFVGGGTSYDAGAIRLDNPNSVAVSVDSVSVDMGRPGPVYSLWKNITVPAQGSAILTQTASLNFVSNGSPITTCGGTLSPNETRIPQITITIAGQATTLADTAHVLDTGGFNLTCRGNASLDWRPIGTTGIEAPAGTVSLSANDSIVAVGVNETFTAAVTDANGQPLGSAALTLNVTSGPDAGKTLQGVSNGQGLASFTFTSSTQGTDTVQALLTNAAGGSLSSNSVALTWASAAACTPPTNPPASATQLIYLGQTSGHYSENVLLAAELTDGAGNALANRTLTFTSGSQSSTAATNANGVAQVTTTLPTGSDAVTVKFAGDSSYNAATVTTSVAVAPEPTILIYTGNLLLGSNATQPVTATLTDSLKRPVASEKITFAVGSTQVQATTNAQGVASANITLPASAAGAGQLTVSFAGDANYKASQQTLPIDVFLAGKFVIWGGNTAGLQLGQTVNFWGAQWVNQVKQGDYFGTSSFKGFAPTVPSFQLCKPTASGNNGCDQSCWNTKPGNSFPPATLPTYIGVIVSDDISKSGSTIFGNIAALAVCKVLPSPPYTNDPGHPGYCVLTSVIADGDKMFPAGTAKIQLTQSQPATVLPNQTDTVAATVKNTGNATADTVALSESFDTVTPPTATNSWTSLATGASQTFNSQETVPSIPTRQSNETSSAYETRLAALDGRVYTSTGTVTFTDATGQPYLPVSATSSSQLQIPRLTLALSGPLCAAPGATIPFSIRITNIGMANAASGTLALTLPDGTTTQLAIPAIAAGASYATTYSWSLVPPGPIGSGQTTAQYLAALAALDNKALSISGALIWLDAAGNSYGDVAAQFAGAVEHLPILSLTGQIPSQLLPNQTLTTQLAVQNTGSGNAVQSKVALRDPNGKVTNVAPFSVASGQTVNASASVTVPSVAAKGNSETDSAYETRLLANQMLYALDAAMAWTDVAGSSFGPTHTQLSSSEVLPVLSATLTGPATANFGDSVSFTLTLQNSGSATASNVSAIATLPDGTTQSLTIPQRTIASGANVPVSFSWTANKTGALNATVAISWRDAASNNYGPITASAAIKVNAQLVVSAGPNANGLPIPNLYTLQGSVTENGAPAPQAVVTWSQVSGVPATFANAHAVDSTVKLPNVDTYQLKLSATDPTTGATGTATVTLSGTQAPLAPVVNAGPDQTISLPVNTASLNGTASDPAGNPLTFTWTLVSGPGTATFSNSSSLTTQVTLSVAGTYTLRLTAVDSTTTLSAASDTHILVTPTNQPPVVSAGPSQTITLPTYSVTLHGTVTDDGLPTWGVLTQLWTVVSGPGAVTLSSPTSTTTTATFTKPGVYDLRLTANDSQYQTSADVAVTVNPANPAGSIALTPESVSPVSVGTSEQFQAVVLSGTGSAITGTAVTFTVVGVNGRPGTGTTDNNGIATFSYTGNASGVDQITATALNGTLISNASKVSWVSSSTPQAGITLGPPGADSTLGLVGLAGAFTDSNGAVIEPLSIGATAKTFAVPIGATQLQLGVNDDIYGDNAGSFVVNVNGTSVNVPGTAMPWNWAPGGLNSGFEFGVRDGANPVIAATGLTQGQTVNIAYQSGLTSANPCCFPFVNADGFGDTDKTKGSSGAFFVTAYMSTLSLNVGQSETFTSVVTNTSGAVVPNQPVVFNVSGANAQKYQTVTDSTGTATFIYEGTMTGGDVIQAQTVANGVPLISRSQSVTWTGTVTQPAIVTIFPSSAGPNAPGGIQAVSAVVTDAQRIPSAGVTVTFNVSGANTATGTAVTDVTGTATFSYTSANVGTDSVVASVTTQGTTISSSAAQITWANVTGNQPPAVSIQAISNVVLPNVANLQGTVSDDGLPQGSVVTSLWSQVSGPAPVAFGNATQPTTTATFAAPGSYMLQLAANDTQYTTTAITIITVDPAPTSIPPGKNQPPVVSATAASPVVLPNTVTLNGKVSDDGLPNGTLTSTWSLLSGPGTVNFSNPSSPVTQATFSAPGVYTLRLAASDSQFTSFAVLSVSAINTPPMQPKPPVIQISGPQSIVLPTSSVTVSGLVTVGGVPNTAVNVAWTEVSGPAPATFANPGSANTQVTFSTAGVYLLQLSASNAQYTTTATTTVTVAAQSGTNPPPTANAGPRQTIYQPNNTVTLYGQVAGGSPNGLLTVSWTELSGPGAASFSNPSSAITQTILPQAGVYLLQLSASDGQNTASSQVMITVVAQPGPPPSVAILSPQEGDEITHPTSVTGNVSNGNWVLDYAAINALGRPVSFVPFASGSGAENGVALGSFDPTILLNGQYTIRLTTTDSFGQSASSTVTVSVARNLKLGIFTLSFNDLSVPLPGLPITVTRTYDSRDSQRVGDFGNGWTLSVANVRVQKNGPIGQFWDEEVVYGGFLPGYCLDPVKNHRVTFTFPDGRVYKFQAVSTPECQQASPITLPQIGFSQIPTGSSTAGAKLIALNGDPNLNIDGAVPGPLNVLDTNGNFVDYSQFQLTTAEGFVYTIDQTLGPTQVQAPNGYILKINPSGVTVIDTTGAQKSSVAFTRDPQNQNRITQIADPNGALISYGYDPSTGDLISVVDRAGNKTQFQYNLNHPHYLANIIDPRGIQAVKNNYDSSGRFVSTTDANNKTVTYNNALGPNQTAVTDRRGKTTVYTYDGDGNVTDTVSPLGIHTKATYDADDNQTSSTDGLGKTTVYSYDGVGNSITEKVPVDQANNVYAITQYAYNTLKEVTATTDALNRVTSNTYDFQGNVIFTQDPIQNASPNPQNTTTDSYTNGLLLSSTDALGKVTNYNYDGNGFLNYIQDTLRNVTKLNNDNNGNKLSQTVTRTLSDGTTQTLKTSFTYDGNNRVLVTTYPDGSTKQNFYNSIGKIDHIIDQLGHKTSYQYDNNGNLQQVTYPDQTTESKSYDEENHLKTSTDRAGNVTTYFYDDDGRLKTTQYADGSTTTTNYDDAGRVSSVTDENGHTTTYGYDDAGRRTTITDAQNHVTHFSYDLAGQEIQMLDANQHKTQYDYDLDGRQNQITFDDGTTSKTGYDANGRMISKTDQAGIVTSYGYDDIGRLTSVTQSPDGTMQYVTQYKYDEVGNRILQTDANGHATAFTYDQLGRHISRTLPMGMAESYSYDFAGNLKTHTDFNGHTTTYAVYDNMNRLLEKDADPYFVQNNLGAAKVTFTYNAMGQRKSMTDASGQTVYNYNDRRNRLTSKQTPFGTLSYSYDNVGNIKTILSSNANGTNVTYGYDVLNRLSTVNDNTSSGQTIYSYDPVGNLQGFTYPNGVTHTYGYDNLNRLTSLSVTSPTCTTQPTQCVNGMIAGYQYTLGSAGNRTAMKEVAGRTVNYGYDNLYRLTSETITGDLSGMNGAVGYSYDAAGNRKQLTSSLSAIPSSGLLFYDANDRTSTDVYDNNGNITNQAGIGDVYDFENHLIQHGAVTVLYDGDGNRMQKSAAGMTTSYLVDTNNPSGYAQVFEELQTGSVVRDYTYGLDLISETQMLNSKATTSFYQFDGHSGVRSLTDVSGAVSATYTYDAFGNFIEQSATPPNYYLYRSQQFDRNLGVYYNRARYLDVRSGRFWSMDTWDGDDQMSISLHKYLYANANPIGNSDPNGTDALADVLLTATISVAFDTMAVARVQTRKHKAGPTPNVLSFDTLEGGPNNRSWVIEWKLMKPSTKRGYIVQRIIDYDASGKQFKKFWEAWVVPMNSQHTFLYPLADDTFQGLPSGTRTEAEARFYDGIDTDFLANWHTSNPDTFAGALPSSTVDPQLPTQDATPPVDRTWKVP